MIRPRQSNTHLRAIASHAAQADFSSYPEGEGEMALKRRTQGEGLPYISLDCAKAIGVSQCDLWADDRSGPVSQLAANASVCVSLASGGLWSNE